jgi:hypothetical protein
MLHSLTIKRVLFMLVVAGVFGLAIGAGITITGTWMVRQNGPGVFELGGTPAFAQTGSYLMQCSKAGEGGSQGTSYHHCVIVNTYTGHWSLTAFSFDEYGTQQWVGNKLGEGFLPLP